MGANEAYAVIRGAEAWRSTATGPGKARAGVVVVHGFTGNPVSVRPLGQALAARGYAVDVPRLPGHGTHWRDLARTGYVDWRQAVDEAVTAMRPRVERLALVGLSMGGFLCLDAGIARQDDVDGVVSINAPFLDREGIVGRLAPFIARIIPSLPASAAGLAKNDAARPGVDEKAYATVPTRAAQSLLEQFPRVRAAAAGMKRPVLVVYSAQDHSVAPANSRAMAQALGAAAEVLVLERSYHLAPLDLDAELLTERIAAFVDGLAVAVTKRP